MRGDDELLGQIFLFLEVPDLLRMQSPFEKQDMQKRKSREIGSPLSFIEQLSTGQYRKTLTARRRMFQALACPHTLFSEIVNGVANARGGYCAIQECGELQKAQAGGRRQRRAPVTESA